MSEGNSQLKKDLDELRKLRGTYETHKMFEEYKKVTGGKNGIGFNIVRGLPKGVEEHGGIVYVYKECIEKKITWEELLGYKDIPKGALA